jgi:hypothetical protein
MSIGRKFHLVYLLAAALMLAACAPRAPVAQPAAPAPATEARRLKRNCVSTAEAEFRPRGCPWRRVQLRRQTGAGLADIPPAERADAFSGPETYVKPDTVYVAINVTDGRHCG